MQDTFARATHSAKRARDDRVSCIQNILLNILLNIYIQSVDYETCLSFIVNRNFILKKCGRWGVKLCGRLVTRARYLKWPKICGRPL